METQHQSPASHPHNLPSLLSSFIGRTRELAEVRQLLRKERLVTLTGAGGSGKTRLALQVAELARESYPAGVWFTEFAALTDGALVAQAVASVLGVQEQGSRPLIETLVDRLEGRQTLLVLDNCEHLVLACAQLAQHLLQSCPSLTILATSREPLGIPGEVIRIVPPLSLPDSPDGWATPGRHAPRSVKSEAVELLLARAQAASPNFTVNDDNAKAVAEICLRLDGMPLAIELAAARLRALSVHQVAELLSDRFQLLTGGSRTAPAHQRTLEATLDWSYALLPEQERRVLQRLSVFAGGCTLAAAEAVCTDQELPAPQLTDALSHLVEKSLVTADGSGGEVRYKVLETIREYGRRKLPADQATRCKDAHLQFFIGWAEGLQPMLQGPELARGMELFAKEHDNVRLALDWSAQAEGDALAGLRLATAALNYWRVVGYHTEGRARLARLLAHPGAQAPTLARANGLHCAAMHAFYQSDYPACKTLCEESRALYEQLGAAGRQGLANSLELLAEVASETAQYEAAFDLYRQALPMYEEVGDMVGLGDTLKMLGFTLMRSGRLDEAKGWIERGLEVCRQTGDLRHICSGLSGLGEWYIRTGRYGEARKSLNESLAISRSTGEKWNNAINLGSLAWVELLEGNLTRMAELMRESLAIRRETGDRGGTAWCLEKLAQAATRMKHFREAATLTGAATALRLPVGSQMDRTDRPSYESALAEARAALGDAGFADAVVTGERMAVAEAVDLGLSLFEQTVPVKERPGGLTERELEVAVLIARGKPNREIAEAMTVSLKTVETYVTRILHRLGFDSRVQVATWALQHGLLKKEE